MANDFIVRYWQDKLIAMFRGNFNVPTGIRIPWYLWSLYLKFPIEKYDEEIIFNIFGAPITYTSFLFFVSRGRLFSIENFYCYYHYFKNNIFIVNFCSIFIIKWAWRLLNNVRIWTIKIALHNRTFMCGLRQENISDHVLLCICNRQSIIYHSWKFVNTLLIHTV